LIEKVRKAVENYQAKSVILSGGVAANKSLRKQVREKLSIPLFYPDLKLCTDNAAMISTVAYYKYKKSYFSPLSLNADPNLKLS